MKIMTRIFAFSGILMLGFFLLACNLDGGTEVQGTSTKGPIDGADVTVYTLNSDGSRGTEIASGTTNESGEYSIDLGDYTGPVAVVARGGSYRDEATGNSVTLKNGEELTSFVQAVQDGENVAVTALTTIAAARAAEQASQGLSTAIANANNEVAQAFGLAGVDISTVTPADLSSTTSQGAGTSVQYYGAVQAGLSQVAADNALSASEVIKLVHAMAEDFASGSFNGQNAAGQPLELAIALTPFEAMTGLETAINAFLQGVENRSGLDSISITVPAP